MNTQCWTGLAGGNTGRLFLTFGEPVRADRISIGPLDRVLTLKFNLLIKFANFCSFNRYLRLYRTKCPHLDRRAEVVAMLFRVLIGILSFLSDEGKGQDPCVEKKDTTDCKLCNSFTPEQHARAPCHSIL